MKYEHAWQARRYLRFWMSSSITLGVTKNMITENPYAAPASKINDSDSGIKINKFTYKSLGIWRKIYLILNWFFSFAITFVWIYNAITDQSQPAAVSLTAVLLSILLLGYTYWLHYAIVQRKLSQLLIIGILNIIPFLNPITAIIVFAIRSTSKLELCA